MFSRVTYRFVIQRQKNYCLTLSDVVLLFPMKAKKLGSTISFRPSKEVENLLEKARASFGEKTSKTWIIERCILKALSTK